MKINSIRIKNFKSWEDRTINFNNQVNVLIGDNGSGKTLVLDALSVSLGSFLRGIDVASQYQKSVSVDQIRCLTTRGESRPQLPVVIHSEGVVNDKDMKWERSVEKISKRTSTRYQNAKNLYNEASNMLSKYRKGEDVTFPLIAYHGTGRLWAEHSKTEYIGKHEGVELGYKRCLSSRSSSKEFLEWYKTYEDEVTKFGSDKDILALNTFKKTIQEALPDEKWTDLHYSHLKEDLIGVFSHKDGTKELLMFGQLSDGYRNTIGMIADLAYRCIKLNPHLGEDAVKKTPGIVLIDEVDMHLHPNWQRNIIRDLKRVFPQVQFILTTHSPYIVQSLTSEEIINLDKVTDVNPNEYTVDEVSEHIMDVKSIHSEKSVKEEQLATEYLNSSEESIKMNSNTIEKISNPAMRAFLKMQKMEK